LNPFLGPKIRNTLHDKGMGEFETTSKYNLGIAEMFPEEIMERPRECVVTDIYIKEIFPLNTPRRSRIVETIDYNLENGTISYLHKPFILEQFHDKVINWGKNKNFNSRIQKLVNIIKRRDISPFPCLAFNWRKLTRI
jgi:hypothetical protein